MGDSRNRQEIINDDEVENENEHHEEGTHIYGEVDTDVPAPRNAAADNQQLAAAAPPDNGRNPFVVAPPKDNPPAPPQPAPERPQEKPPEQVRPAPPADRPAEPVTDNLLTQLPEASRDATTRALQLFQQVRPGQALTAEQRRVFEQAVADAGRIDPKWAAEREQQLTAEVETRSRKLPSGLVLPPWTKENEIKMWDTLGKTDQAFRNMPEDTRGRVAQLEDRLKTLGPADQLGRAQVQQALQAEARNDSTGKVSAYLTAKMAADTFMRENAMGIARRNLHQQEMGLLHSTAITSGIYALALDKAGQAQDKAAIEKLLKPVVQDQFAMTNFPDFVQLKEKYKIKEEDPLDDKVPGRASLKQAIDIMNDAGAGTMAERLKKAGPLFEQAIGASDQIDSKKVNERLEKIAEEASKLDKEKDKQRLDELDKEAVELLEQARQPGLARLTYGLWMNNTAVESGDKAMRERAATMLRNIQNIDSGARYDPLIQGAIKMASSDPPQRITPENAVAAGKPEVDRIKAEEAAANKKPEEPPFWRKALAVAGDAAVGLAAMYALSYAFKPVFAGKNYLSRSWEATRRVNSVELAQAPGAAPGSEPKLYFRDAATGVEKPVEGVRMEDGSLRVRNGENLEIVKPTAKDKLIMRVPPGTNLTPEEVRAAARKVLAPTTVELQLQEGQRQMQQLLEQQQREIERLRAEAEARPGGAERAPAAGDKVQLEGKEVEVAGNRDGKTIVHQRNVTEAASAEPITADELKTKYEEVRLQIDGKEQVRYLEKGHPEKGLFKVSQAAGETLISQDNGLRIVEPAQLGRPAQAPTAPSGSSGTGGGAERPAPEARAPLNRPAPELPSAPTAERLTGTEVVIAQDGTMRMEERRVGESLTVEKLKEQRELDSSQIRFLEEQAEKLKKSENAAERAQGEKLAHTASALKGEFGPEAKASAHQQILDSTRKELERRGGGGKVAAAVGLGILASAALAWYISSQNRQEAPLRRPTVGR